MTWKKKLLKNFKLYAVTNIHFYDVGFLRKVESACKAGIDILQLRSKHLTDKEFVRLGLKMRAITAKYQKLFFVNDRPDLCCSINADGVHIGQDDLPVECVRAIVKDKYFIGKSTHSIQQVKKTITEEIDYIAYGPLYGTPTKPTYVPVGIQEIPKVIKLASMPVVFIGGINSETIKPVISAGARRVAVVRAVWDKQRTFQAVKELKRYLP